MTSTYTDLQDYTYYFVPAPWLCVTLLRLLQNYPPPGWQCKLSIILCFFKMTPETVPDCLNVWRAFWTKRRTHQSRRKSNMQMLKMRFCSKQLRSSSTMTVSQICWSVLATNWALSSPIERQTLGKIVLYDFIYFADIWPWSPCACWQLRNSRMMLLRNIRRQ